MAIVLVVVLVLIAAFVPILKHNRDRARSSERGGITAMLTRVARAKEMYAADKHLTQGAPVSLDTLVAKGYLPAQDRHDHQEAGVRFIIGPVGTPVTYTFDPASPHEDDNPSVSSEPTKGYPATESSPDFLSR